MRRIPSHSWVPKQRVHGIASMRGSDGHTGQRSDISERVGC
jgi:hypothetical protein